MNSVEAAEQLNRLRRLLKPLTAECVDDPEEITTELACSAPEFMDAIDVALENLEDA